MITDQRIAQISKVNSLKAQGHVDSAVQHVSELLVELERLQRENAELKADIRLADARLTRCEAKLAAAEAALHFAIGAVDPLETAVLRKLCEAHAAIDAAKTGVKA